MKTLFAEFCEKLVGSNGNYVPTTKNLESIYGDYMYWDYYHGYGPCKKTVEKYYAGTSVLPRSVRMHYVGEDGYARLYTNMVRLVDAYASIIVLQHICDGIHDWVCSNIPAAADTLSVYYCDNMTTRDDMARYIADVMHYVLAA